MVGFEPYRLFRFQPETLWMATLRFTSEDVCYAFSFDTYSHMMSLMTSALTHPFVVNASAFAAHSTT